MRITKISPKPHLMTTNFWNRMVSSNPHLTQFLLPSTLGKNLVLIHFRRPDSDGSVDGGDACIGAISESEGERERERPNLRMGAVGAGAT